MTMFAFEHGAQNKRQIQIAIRKHFRNDNSANKSVLFAANNSTCNELIKVKPRKWGMALVVTQHQTHSTQIGSTQKYGNILLLCLQCATFRWFFLHFGVICAE